MPPLYLYIPCKEDLDAIQELVKTKYETWRWNFGNNPSSTIYRSSPLPEGVLEIHLELEKGCIQLCHLTGNFATPIRFGEVAKIAYECSLHIRRHPERIDRS